MHDADFTAYRLVIEGWGAEAVTDRRMETVTTDDVLRIHGLLRDGLAIEEEVDVARGEVESSGFTAKIVDRQYDQVWCEFCAKQPSLRTWLTADIDATTDPATVSVDSTAGFSSGDFIHIGTECLEVSTVTNATTMSCKRAARGTIAQAHYTDEGENLSRPVVTHTYPLSLEGRRAYLYEYRTDEHDLEGDGELVWRGIASTDSKLGDDNATWSILIDSIYTLLKQDIGGDTEVPFSLRGYYYSVAEPLGITVSYRESGSVTLTDFAQFDITGHYETVYELVDEINASIPSVVATYTDGHVANSFQALALDDGGWGISLETDGTETGSISVEVGGAEFMDGGSNNAAVMTAYTTVTATQVFEFERPMRAPRGVWGPHTVPGRIIVSTAADDPNNIFPDGLVLLNEGDTIVLENLDGAESESFVVSYEDDANRQYQIEGNLRSPAFFNPDTVPRFTKHATYARNANLANFRDALVANGPADANRGAGPFVTTEDIGDWGPAVARALRTVGSIGARHYIAAQATKLDEMLAAECQLLGLFPRLNSDGKINLAYLELPTATTPVSVEFDDSNILISDTPPQWERNAINGTINTVELLTGYDPVEDEHTGPTFLVRDVTAISTYKKTKQLTVEPKSMDAGTFNAGDVTNAFKRMLGVFGRPYSVITLDVPRTLRGVIFNGNFCSITNHRIPNVVTGERGVTGIKGIIIRQAWDFSMAHGQVSVMVSDAQLVGYTPTVYVSASSGAGNERTLTVAATDPTGAVDLAPSGMTMATMFPVDTRVELMQWDTLTQTPQQGTVTAVTDTTLTVDFDSAPTLTGTRYLRYAKADEVDLSTQETWAYMGLATSLVEFVNGDKTAPEFAA